METKTFRPYNLDQLYLLPPSLKEWLPPDHLVYFISDAVDQLDLSAIYRSYDNPKGYPPYNPTMMVKVLFYAYCRGIRSSRRIERALYEDVAMRVLSGNQQPDHWTIAAFRRRHLEALGELFVQTVKLARDAGLVRLGHVALDGTKIKANASRHQAMSYGRMKREEERLQQEIDRYFREAEAIDREEDRRYGDRRGDELPPELADARRRLEVIRKAKAALEEEARRRAELEKGERPQGAADEGKKRRCPKESKPPEPPEKAQRNFTDPESRIMKSSEGSFVQAYNAQAAVDAESQIIVAADLTNQAADSPHLIPLVEQVEGNTGRRPKEVSADAGYWSEANVTALAVQGIEAFIPPDKVRHSEWRQFNPPRGRIPANLSLKERMRRKLRTRRGRERYRLRQTSVEPVFGQIKEGRGLRQFLLRGLAPNRAMWRFDCAVHNLLKLFRAGVNWRTAAATG